VNKLVEPSEDALSDVHDWFESHGVDRAQLSYSAAKDWIKARLPVSDIERLLDTQYFIYEHEYFTQLVRAAAWSLPSHLHEHIEMVRPTNSFFRPKPHRRSLNIVQPDIEIREEPSPHQKEVLKVSEDVTLAQVCNPTSVTPVCLRTLYGTIDYVPKMPGKNKVALNNYDGQTSNRSDIALILSQYRPDAVPAAQTFTIDVRSGSADQQSPINAIQAKAGLNGEGDLDAQLLLSFGYPTPLIAYKTGGKPPPYQEDASEGPNDINEVSFSCIDTGVSPSRSPSICASCPFGKVTDKIEMFCR
jgi:tripeptidyl-peptidase-1